MPSGATADLMIRAALAGATVLALVVALVEHDVFWAVVAILSFLVLDWWERK